MSSVRDFLFVCLWIGGSGSSLVTLGEGRVIDIDGVESKLKIAIKFIYR